MSKIKSSLIILQKELNLLVPHLLKDLKQYSIRKDMKTQLKKQRMSLIRQKIFQEIYKKLKQMKIKKSKAVSIK